MRLWGKSSFLKNSVDYSAKAVVKDNPPATGCEKQEVDTTLPHCSLPNGNPTTRSMRKVCELCTKRKRKCDGNGGLQCCTLCISKNVPCFYREKRRRGPKPKKGLVRAHQKLTFTRRDPVPQSEPSYFSVPAHVWGSDGRILDLAINEEGGFGLTEKNSYGHQKPDNESHGLVSQKCPSQYYMNASHLARAGANMSSYPADTSVFAPTDKVVMPGSYSSHTIPASRSDSIGYMQGEDRYTGRNSPFSGLQMGGRASDRHCYEAPLPLMANEPPMSVQNLASAYWANAALSGDGETFPRGSSSQNKIAHFLANMARCLPNNGSATDGK